MTTLVMGSLERRLLQAVKEEVAAEAVGEWPLQAHRLCWSFLRQMRDSAAERRQALEEVLAEGVEARSFARTYRPFLAAIDEHLVLVGELVQSLSSAEDIAAESLAAELRLLEREDQGFRDLLARALARASEAPRPVDWGRVRAAEEAQARGETKPFSRR